MTDQNQLLRVDRSLLEAVAESLEDYRDRLPLDTTDANNFARLCEALDQPAQPLTTEAAPVVTPAPVVAQPAKPVPMTPEQKAEAFQKLQPRFHIVWESFLDGIEAAESFHHIKD